MKIIIIGGHLAPALSVLEALPKNTQVLFVGRKYALEGDNALSLEYNTITSLNIPFVGLNTGRLQRKITRFTLFSLLKLPFGIIKSFLILIPNADYISRPMTVLRLFSLARWQASMIICFTFSSNLSMKSAEILSTPALRVTSFT